MSLLDNI